MTAVEVLRWVATVGFVSLAAAAVWTALRTRHRAGVWAAVTFVSLGFVSLVGRFIGEDAPTFLGKLQILVLVIVPWALFRFAASFGGFSQRSGRFVDAAIAALAVWTLLLPDRPLAGSTDLLDQAYVLVLVVLFAGLSSLVSVRLWRGGKDEPTVARRRMRLLSVASGLLATALVIAAYAPRNELDQALIQLLAVSSAVAFLVGLTPPTWLKVVWRQREERQLYESAIKLLSARSGEMAAKLVAPNAAALAGARAVEIVDDTGRVLARHGGEQPKDAPHEVSAGRARVRVWPSSYTPFFGEEEEHLLRRLALLTGLGLERSELLAREQRSRRALERANVDLAATNEELESFVYTASHDLKSPMIALLGYLHALTEDHVAGLDDEARWYLERMTANGRYMEALVGDLLEFSRVGRLDTATAAVDLRAVVEEVVADLVPAHPAASIEVGELPTVEFNPHRARQLVANLLENACRHAGREDVHVSIAAATQPDGAVVVSVQDDGVGIPPEYHERVFGMFERLSPDDRSGTGIGLAISSKIAAVSGASLSLVPTDVGARFDLRFPPKLVRRGSDQEVTT